VQEAVSQSKSNDEPNQWNEDCTVLLLVDYTPYSHFLLVPNLADDGIFQEIMLKEIAAVRKAFYEINQSAKDASSDVHTQECQGKGCVLCTPPITFIVAQSHHDVRIVPDVHDRLDTSNVPSGTCVDDYKLMSPMTGTVLARLDANEISTNSPLQLFQNADEKRFDFFLIAHGQVLF
jgi:hypothetical protein